MGSSDRAGLEVQVIDGQRIEFALHRGTHKLVVLLHGGHFHAGMDLGLESFRAAGWSVLQPSRPGYGRTPLTAGPDAASFADRVARLCGVLGYGRACAVGISAGGRTAMHLAARHPELIEGLILESSISFEPWPDRRTRRIAGIVFRPGVERVVWAMTSVAFRVAPTLMLRSMMGSLSTVPAQTVVDDLSAIERQQLVGVFRSMRSRHGFANDLQPSAAPTVSIEQPTLIVASPDDGSVDQSHAAALQRMIPQAERADSAALSHFLWVGSHATDERLAVQRFLATLR